MLLLFQNTPGATRQRWGQSPHNFFLKKLSPATTQSAQMRRL